MLPKIIFLAFRRTGEVCKFICIDVDKVEYEETYWCHQN